MEIIDKSDLHNMFLLSVISIDLQLFYRGESANKKFLHSIKRVSEKLLYYLKYVKRLKMSKADRIELKNAKHWS